MMSIFALSDWIALGWFVSCWAGYTYWARYQQERVTNIAKSLILLREKWVRGLISRETRISDMTALTSLQRVVTFFASTTVLILAGLLAVLGASDQAMKLFHALPFVAEHTQAAWELKVLFMVCIFIYGFFKFSWSVRQYNFAIVMFGAAPKEGAHNVKSFCGFANDLLTQANNSFNYGLRAYTFAMATIAWFINPWLFMIATGWVLAVLYRREFYSKTLAAMKAANLSFENSEVATNNETRN